MRATHLRIKEVLLAPLVFYMRNFMGLGRFIRGLIISCFPLSAWEFLVSSSWGIRASAGTIWSIASLSVRLRILVVLEQSVIIIKPEGSLNSQRRGLSSMKLLKSGFACSTRRCSISALVHLSSSSMMLVTPFGSASSWRVYRFELVLVSSKKFHGIKFRFLSQRGKELLGRRRYSWTCDSWGSWARVSSSYSMFPFSELGVVFGTRLVGLTPTLFGLPPPLWSGPSRMDPGSLSQLVGPLL